MGVEVTREGNVTIASVAGSFDAGTADEIQAKAGASAAGALGLVIDLSKAGPLVSSGLSGLVRINDALVRSGGKLVLCSPSEGVRTVLDLTNLLQIFKVAESLDAARGMAEVGGAG